MTTHQQNLDALQEKGFKLSGRAHFRQENPDVDCEATFVVWSGNTQLRFFGSSPASLARYALEKLAEMKGEPPAPETPTVDVTAKVPVCTACLSKNVRADAFAEWDSESGEWVLQQHFHEYYCVDCDGKATVSWQPVYSYQNELVERCAPRWAWEVIDETLAADSESKAFDPLLRGKIGAALQAMIDACEGEEA